MNLPKTAHLTNFFHATSGGISAFYRALFAHANRQGRQMRLIVPGEQSGAEAVGDFGKMYVVRAPRSPWIDGRYRILMPLGGGRREIQRILAEEQPAVLEVSDKYSLPYISGLIRKRLMAGVQRPTEIATSHERMDDSVAAHLSSGCLGRAFSRLYMRFIYFAQFDHHIANSAYTAEELVPASKGHTTRRGIWICPMGVDASLFRPSDGPAPPRTKLVYAGRLAREKNVSMLLDMLERLPAAFTLDIMGDGPERHRLAACARARLGNRVTLCGFVADRRGYLDRLHQAGVFLHPNPREPFGIGPLEAMACGIPVVVPASGGVLSYATRDNAWLCAATAEDFAEAVRAVAADERECRRRCRNARRTAELHDWALIADRYFTLLDRLHQAGFAGMEAPPLGAARDAWELVHGATAR